MSMPAIWEEEKTQIVPNVGQFSSDAILSGCLRISCRTANARIVVAKLRACGVKNSSDRLWAATNQKWMHGFN